MLATSTVLLTMEHGPVPMSELVGQAVTIVDGNGNPVAARVSRVRERRAYQLTFRQNTTGPLPGVKPTVTATKSQNWPLHDGSVTPDIEVGNVIAAPVPAQSSDRIAIVHGMIFGDGSAHKRRRDAVRPAVSQGRTYASLRVSKTGTIGSEMHSLLDAAGYKFSTPPHANGERVYYLGKFAHAKELPFNNDPEYIAGFIYGWWLADGSKAISHAREISTSDQMAADWLCTHASYAGYRVTMDRELSRTVGDGSFPNGKPLRVIRVRQNLSMKVAEIIDVGVSSVCEITHFSGTSYVLGNGLLIAHPIT